MSSSDLEFTTAGPVAPESAAVKAAVTADWQAAFDNQLNADDATPQGQLIVSETAIVQDKNAQILHLANQFDPAQAENRFQDALGSIYFIERQAARASVVQCVCTGRAGTSIPGADTSAEPALAADEDGNTFVCQTTGEIGADGTVVLPFAAEEPGPLVVPAPAGAAIVRAIPGWDTVAIVSAVTGQSVEGRRAFEERRRASVARNSRSMLASIYSRVGDVEGVIDLIARQNRTDAPLVVGGVELARHSAYVAVLGGDDAAIAEAIYDSVSGGCDYNGNTEVLFTDPLTGAVETIRFQRPTALDVGVRVPLRLTASTPSDIVARVRANILADFLGEPYPYGAEDDDSADGRARIGSEIYASRFYRPARAAGAANLLTIQIAADGGERGDVVSMRIDQYPTLTAAGIDVEVVP